MGVDCVLNAWLGKTCDFQTAERGGGDEVNQTVRGSPPGARRPWVRVLPPGRRWRRWAGDGEGLSVSWSANQTAQGFPRRTQ